MNWNRNFDNGQNNRGSYAGNAQRRNSGYQQQQGGNVQGGYKPNTGKAKINEKRRGPKDPVWTGVGNIMTEHGQVTAFISIWENEDGTLGLAFKDANAPQEQGRGNGGYQQPRGGQNRGNEGYNPPQAYQQPQQRQNGAMSRARPIPPAQYQNGPYDDRSPPPITDYPEHEPDYNVNYDDNEPKPY